MQLEVPRTKLSIIKFLLILQLCKLYTSNAPVTSLSRSVSYIVLLLDLKYFSRCLPLACFYEPCGSPNDMALKLLSTTAHFTMSLSKLSFSDTMSF